MNNRHTASADDVIHYLSTVLRFDRNELLNKLGKLKRLRELPLDIAAVLDIDVQLNKSGIQIPVMKIPGRASAAAELARIYGLYKDKLHLTGDVSKMSEEDMKAELERLAYETLEELRSSKSLEDRH